jgi:hypothetical protein
MAIIVGERKANVKGLIVSGVYSDTQCAATTLVLPGETFLIPGDQYKLRINHPGKR